MTLDLLITKGCTGAEWRKGGHAQVTLIIDRAPRGHNGTEDWNGDGGGGGGFPRPLGTPKVPFRSNQSQR